MLSSVDRDAVLSQLERVLRSDVFRRSDRSTALLRFVVERALNGGADQLKEYTLGVEALGRGSSFDPRIDPVVRAEASRLRDRLDRYYDGEGQDDPVLLVLPKGSYVPRFESRADRPTPSVVPDAVESVSATQERAWQKRNAWLVSSALLLIATIAAGFAWRRSSTMVPSAASVVQFEVELGTDATLSSEVGTDVVLSPDGTRLVFVARDKEGRANLFTRRLDQPTVTKLPGTEGARVPFMSPDGRWIGFWASGKVKRIAADGGSPVILCEATDLLGASWGEDGVIIAALNPTGRLWRIPETGGTPKAIFNPTADSATPQWPQLLPGGRAVVYAAQTRFGADRAIVEARTLPDGERKVLVRGGTFPRYLATGYLTYVNQGTVYAVPFDAERLEVRGPAVPVLDDVAYSRTFGYAQLDVARTGILVYRRSAGGGKSIVALVDRAGQASALTTTPGHYNWPRLSPDGSRTAFTGMESGTASLWIVKLGDHTPRQVAGVSSDQGGLAWWLDGRRLIIGARTGMSWIDTDRTDAPHPLSTSQTVQVPWSLAPGGRRLSYHEFNGETGFDLWTVPVVASGSSLALGKAEPFLRTKAFEVYPAFSPDGRWIAYSSNESGRYEIYVRGFPHGETAVRVSTNGGRIPAWSSRGPELLYQSDDQRLMVARYRVAGNAFVVAPAREWMPGVLGDAGVLPSFDIAPDGEHVVALLSAARPEERQSRNHVTFVLNFHQEVGRRAAARDR